MSSSSPITSLPPSYSQHSPLTSFNGGGYGTINGDTTPVEASSFVTVPLNSSSSRKVQKILLTKGYYFGEAMSGMKDGKGTQFDENETIIYDGDWVKNKRHGHGFSFDPQTGLTYTGQWSENDKVGSGKITLDDGSVFFVGIFEADQPFSGTMNVRNEGTYSGGWKDEQFHSGTFTDLDGKVFHYANGERVETTKGCCIIL